MNDLNNADVIRKSREIADRQTEIFLELLKDFLNLSDINISEEAKTNLRSAIQNKIDSILKK